MIRLVRSEWIKATSTKAWWILFIVGAALTMLSSLPILLVAGLDDVAAEMQFTLGDAETMRSLWATAGSAGLIALILGILGFTGEYRHETITDTFLTEPRRGVVIGSKAVVYGVLAALLAVVTAVTTAVIILLSLNGREHAAYDWTMVGRILAGVVLCYVCYSILGVAVGALITNQLAAILVAVLWVLLVESFIVAFKPEVGKWLPGGAASGILGGTTLDGSPLLTPWLGAAVLIGYALALALIAAFTTLRRDIT